MSRTIPPLRRLFATRLGPCVLLAAGLVACATTQEDGSPGCQGARRPANPHGSVLGPGATPAPDLQSPKPPASARACAGSRR